MLEVHTAESGYRYYDFAQSARVIEYLRLRNYGLSIKEMQSQFDISAKEAMANLSAKKAELARELVRIQSVK